MKIKSLIGHFVLIFLSLFIGFCICLIVVKKPIVPVLHIPNGNSHSTYFSVHNITEAWNYSKGEDIKIGIMDGEFGVKKYSNLYAGWKECRKTSLINQELTISHGYNMASTLHEIAPKASIYALGVVSDKEENTVLAIEKAIDWAINNHIDILTYSQKQISNAGRKRLKATLDRAYKAGILTIFIHYPDSRNILTSQNDPYIDELGSLNNPDFDIFKYDYSTIKARSYTGISFQCEINNSVDFFSISSTAPVAAGIISILISAVPDLDRSKIKEILLKTSYRYEEKNIHLENAVDLKSAIEYCIDKYNYNKS